MVTSSFAVRSEPVLKVGREEGGICMIYSQLVSGCSNNTAIAKGMHDGFRPALAEGTGGINQHSPSC